MLDHTVILSVTVAVTSLTGGQHWVIVDVFAVVEVMDRHLGSNNVRLVSHIFTLLQKYKSRCKNVKSFPKTQGANLCFRRFQLNTSSHCKTTIKGSCITLCKCLHSETYSCVLREHENLQLKNPHKLMWTNRCKNRLQTSFIRSTQVKRSQLRTQIYAKIQ